MVITNPCACKSQRDTDFPQTRNRGKASWSVRELKRPTGKCEFTNVQLNDILRDRFICGLRAEYIEQKLLSANFTFQEAVDAAIAQKIAQKDVRHFGGNPHGESSSSCLNQVKRDNVWSHGHSVGRRHRRKRCFRRWLNNHTSEKCKYKDSECFNCHLRGHSRSVAMQNH